MFGQSPEPPRQPSDRSVQTLALLGPDVQPEVLLAFASILRRVDELERALEGQCRD